MANPLTDKDGEVRELTEADFSNGKPAREVLGDIVGDEVANTLMRRKRGERGPQKTPTKQPVYIRFSPEVVAYFKSTGKGWQTRINEALKEWIREHDNR